MSTTHHGSPYRAKINAYAKKQGICTQCFSRKATSDRVQCLYCITLNRKKFRKRKLKALSDEKNNTKKSA